MQLTKEAILKLLVSGLFSNFYYCSFYYYIRNQLHNLECIYFE